MVDLDLRWGVTEEEAENGKVLEIILEEIERSRPFFIALLGERYGSLPKKLSQGTEIVYPWLKKYRDHSITALRSCMVCSLIRSLLSEVSSISVTPKSFVKFQRKKELILNLKIHKQHRNLLP
jgi:hypothetical protein